MEIEGKTIAGVICNGRQAGGGQILAPKAYIDDGLLDIVIILAFPVTALAEVVSEILDFTHSGTYVKRFQRAWVEFIPKTKSPLNLDGEPYSAKKIHFEVCPKEIALILPEGCPTLKKSGL